MPLIKLLADKKTDNDDDDSYHHAGGDGDAPAAVCVRHDVAVAHTEEGDGDEPHGVQQVGVLLIMIPEIVIVIVLLASNSKS